MLRMNVTRQFLLRDLDDSGDDIDALLELVEELCDQIGEDVEDYLWRAMNRAEHPISGPDALRTAVEELVAEDLRLEPEELRDMLRRSEMER